MDLGVSDFESQGFCKQVVVGSSPIVGSIFREDSKTTLIKMRTCWIIGGKNRVFKNHCLRRHSYFLKYCSDGILKLRG
jgi:hypothetical protein